MKILCLTACFCLFLSAAHAQQIDAGKTADSVFVPLKYRDIHKRNPVLACLLSSYIPGLGQIYNKQVGKGAIIFGTLVLSFDAAEIYHGSHTVNSYNISHRRHDAVTAALLAPMAAAYVYSIIDAPVTANWLNKTYHLGKKKSLGNLSLQPSLMSLSPQRYTAGLSLVLR